jgi:hypothetical protein
MKVCDCFSHLDAQLIISEKSLFEEINNCLTINNLSFVRGNPARIKKLVGEKFNEQGWADRINLKNSKISISFLKSRVGVCFQIGNVARMYADILKLSYLFDEGIIEVGVLCVPHQIESSLLGANYARYDRLKTELKLFKNIIKVPILIICISN